MNNKVNVSWSGEMAFEAEVNDFKIKLDADEKVGGKNTGPRPKALSLVSLGGCTGMDVVSILAKMRIVPDTFDVEVTGELTEEHPKYYDKIHLVYSFKGKDLPYSKLEKAINLSQERYCGVNAMLGKAAEVTYEIRVEE
ncbi:MAG: OsmC family protein [Bacteroidales bacterium]|jgi:putative redox protein|nr:osmotically inducible protein C [Lentimicrobiaceae bacterium]MDG1136607.1 OsmC family protein [Bacteroidales bacterium]MDG1901640.1 OsmC family protein [Bacteroidales bacterium]MDG2081689.1 OsmC family protein [Bacteroidales bacterium]|tara:strand:- start:989 stop:1405 length:417 start_codon:yes stop_codon:yes gene_type:complete